MLKIIFRGMNIAINNRQMAGAVDGLKKFKRR